LGGSPSLIAGTTVIPGISIGENALIGAGACVVCDIPDGARMGRTRENQKPSVLKEITS